LPGGNVDDAGQIDAQFSRNNVYSNNRAIGVLTILVKPRDEDPTIARLSRNPRVGFVAQDRYAHALGTPNDPSFPKQYNLKITHWDLAYTANPTLGGLSSTVIAIVDTGIDLSHRTLPQRICPVCPSSRGRDAERR